MKQWAVTSPVVW